MDTTGESNCVAVFERHDQAEQAIRKLQHGGFDMKKLSIIGRDYHTEEHAVGFYNAGDHVRHWGKLGAFWGTVFGILFAPAFIFIPGIGPILMGTVEGAAVGAAIGGSSGVFAAALTSLGIPKEGIVRYEAELKANKFLLIANGTSADVERARVLLAQAGASEVQVHPR
jgi:uncharacterized membrane protein